MKFRGKRFLITQPIMYWFCGTMVITVELAEYLRSQGADVVIYTYDSSDEIMALCDRARIKVISATNLVAETGEIPSLHLTDFDYVWVHSEVLPESMIRELCTIGEKKKVPYFIFAHMSPHDYAPDEFAWNYQLEAKLADKIIFVSEEARDHQKELTELEIPINLFRNPAPVSYLGEPKSGRVLKKVLVVSNHVPDEVNEAIELLKKRGIEVDHLGGKGNKRELIRPEMISEYDAVITIGKTVQYCILMNVPVYIYDSFGGPGYLTADNFERAKYHNFSGRGFDKKSGEEIVDEMMEKFPENCDYEEIKACDLNEFQIHEVLENIFSDLEKRKKENFSEAQVLALCHAQRAAQYRFAEQHANINFYNEVQELKKCLKAETKRRQEVERKLETVTSAKSYKMLVKVFGPINKLRAKIRREERG